MKVAKNPAVLPGNKISGNQKNIPSNQFIIYMPETGIYTSMLIKQKGCNTPLNTVCSFLQTNDNDKQGWGYYGDIRGLGQR